MLRGNAAVNSSQRTWMKRSFAGIGAITIGLWGTLIAMSQGPLAPVNASPLSNQHGAHHSHTQTSKLLLGLSGQHTSLPSGPLIVEAMAPWCMYCATTARWVDAADFRWTHQHHVPFVLVDTSSLGGVGVAAKAPTLASILKTAHDGSKTPLATNTAIAANLRRFQQTYHLTMPMDFFRHGQAPISWGVTTFPTFIYLNAQHQVVATLTGFNTTSQFAHWAKPLLKGRKNYV